jgi:hypothetical protein
MRNGPAPSRDPSFTVEIETGPLQNFVVAVDTAIQRIGAAVERRDELSRTATAGSTSARTLVVRADLEAPDALSALHRLVGVVDDLCRRHELGGVSVMRAAVAESGGADERLLDASHQAARERHTIRHAPAFSDAHISGGGAGAAVGMDHASLLHRMQELQQNMAGLGMETEAALLREAMIPGRSDIELYVGLRNAVQHILEENSPKLEFTGFDFDDALQLLERGIGHSVPDYPPEPLDAD